MHHQSVALTSYSSFLRDLHHPNPNPYRFRFLSGSFPLHPITTITANSSRSAFSCRGFHITFPTHPFQSCSSYNAANSAVVKTVDVATLGNLCVDIVLNVPKLPPPPKDARKAFMEELFSSPPDQQYWEAGGNCNMAIAAARLGLNCVTIGHVGNEIYGKFLLDVLHEEGIRMVEMSEETDVLNSPSSSYETMLCWVLVDPSQKHGFCG